MRNTSTKNSIYMFDYIGEGNTLYDLLGKYLPNLKGDFSTVNLINKLNETMHANGGDTVADGFYEEVFDAITDNLLNEIQANRQGKTSKFPRNKEQDLLEKLQESDNDTYYYDTFNSLEEYILDLKENPFKEQNKPLRDQIVKNGIQVLDPKQVEKIRHLLLKTVYVPKAQEVLKNKYKTYEERINNPEWERMENVASILSNQMYSRTYDSFLEQHKIRENRILMQQEMLLKQQELTDRCDGKRNFYVTTQLYDMMNLEEKQKANEDGIVNSILGNIKDQKIPRKGTYKWEFKKYKKPVVICDTEANYSNDGIENQRVIAISYGTINYSKPRTKQSSEGLELVGVTRIGADKERTYFVVTGFDRAELKKSEDAENDKKLDLYVDGKNAKIKEKDTNREYVLVEKDRIPEELEDYYSKIFFSDVYLDAVEKYYHRYAGIVVQDENSIPKIKKDTALQTFLSDSEAIRYATKYAGICGTGHASLEELCESNGIIADLQKNMVHILRNKPKEKELEKNSDKEVR